MKIGITERGDAALDLSWIESHKKCDGLILITKAPSKIIEHLSKITVPYIVHCTITGFGGSVIEPNVNIPEIEIKAYKELMNTHGRHNIVLRIDPIIPTEKGIETACKIADYALGRVRISFLDMYDHVKERFREHNIEIPYSSFHAPLELRKRAFDRITNVLFNTPEVCGEPDFECTGCVSKIDLTAMNLTIDKEKTGYQRQFCCCLAEKYELLKNKCRCQHFCAYCYWRNK